MVSAGTYKGRANLLKLKNVRKLYQKITEVIDNEKENDIEKM